MFSVRFGALGFHPLLNNDAFVASFGGVWG